MLKLTRKADYGLIAMRHLAGTPQEGARSAKDLAVLYSIPPEALAKILQKLVRAGLLVSQQGTNGGYALARPAQEISALEVIRAIDGPLFLTSCGSSKAGGCSQTDRCTVREPLQKVSRTIEEVLQKLTLGELAESPEQVEAELVSLS
jgi:Rrf2 family protein